jgi:hypothetical protein
MIIVSQRETEGLEAQKYLFFNEFKAFQHQDSKCRSLNWKIKLFGFPLSFASPLQTIKNDEPRSFFLSYLLPFNLQDATAILQYVW